MGTRDIQEWYKLAFRLLISEKWDVIADRVENGDQTYRWLKELLIQKLRSIERDAWETGLASTAFTIKERLQPLKGYIISQQDFLKAQHWLKFPKGLLVIRDEGFTPSQRVLGGRLAVLESFLKHHDDSTAASGAICQIFNNLVDIEEVVSAIYEKDDPKLASNVKEMYDLAKEYAERMKIPLEDLVELEFEPGCLSTDPPEPYKPPETWVFGDVGDEEGQFSSPYKVVVDQEGNYLVLDQDIIAGPGVVVTQRLQLFNPLGKLIKVILKRGEGKVNGMGDFCLNKSGNIVVVDEDDQERARIQVFGYDGNQLMVINVAKDDPESCPRVLTVCVDEDDNIIAADMGCTCVWLYGPDGKVKSRFGKWGRHDGGFMDLRSAYAKDKQIYAFDQGGNVIFTKVFDYDGNFIKTIWHGYTYMQIVFHTDGKIYTVLSDQIHRIDLEGNREVVAIKGDSGDALDDYHCITSAAFLPDGRMVVSESGIHQRIKVLKI